MDLREIKVEVTDEECGCEGKEGVKDGSGRGWMVLSFTEINRVKA